jgi:hypothetical protein
MNLLLRVMLDIVSEPGSRTSAHACVSLCSTALAQGCELLACSFLPASVQAAHADSDFPDLVQSELQRLLLSVKSRCYSLACGPLEEGACCPFGFFDGVTGSVEVHGILFFDGVTGSIEVHRILFF